MSFSYWEEDNSCRSPITSQNIILQEETDFENSTEDVSGRQKKVFNIKALSS